MPEVEQIFNQRPLHYVGEQPIGSNLKFAVRRRMRIRNQEKGQALLIQRAAKKRTAANLTQIGASGAVCGLVAVLLASRPTGERAGFLPILCLPWLALEYLGLRAQNTGSPGWIGHGAHLGGALAGLVLSQLAPFKPKRNQH